MTQNINKIDIYCYNNIITNKIDIKLVSLYKLVVSMLCVQIEYLNKHISLTNTYVCYRKSTNYDYE